MNRRLARALVRMYPRAWRERYGAEFAALLEDRPGRLSLALDVMMSALGERVLPSVRGGEMASRLQRWSAKAPWAVFGIAPVVMLAAAYFVALMILWSGWQIFLPSEQTPFVPVTGWAVAWFGVGRVLYYGAPLLAGLWLAVSAGRSRARVVWPVIGAAAMALIDSVIQVSTVRPTLSEAGRVRLQFASWHPAMSIAVLALTVAVYWLLRVRSAQTLAM